MSKPIIISGIFGLLVIGAFVFVITSNKAEAPKSSSSQSSATQSPNNNQTEPANQPAASAQNYVDYSDGVIAKTSGEKVLFFHAPWCPQCNAIEKDILAQGVPGNLTIIKVDYDSNQDLRQKYGVTLQTTFVKIDDRGEFKDKYVAYNEPTLDAVKRDFLN